LQGVHEPFLRLKHLTEGVYTFELLVTDTKGQTSKDEVRVFVQTSLNKPPVAMVEHNFTTAKPQDVVLLDGSPSSDDQGIVQYKWTQLRYLERNYIMYIIYSYITYHAHYLKFSKAVVTIMYFIVF